MTALPEKAAQEMQDDTLTCSKAINMVVTEDIDLANSIAGCHSALQMLQPHFISRLPQPYPRGSYPFFLARVIHVHCAHSTRVAWSNVIWSLASCTASIFEFSI